MSSPGPLMKPYERLVKIQIGDKQFDVPEGNTLLRCFQFLAAEAVSYGRFCWNEDCQYCRVTYDMGEGTQARKAISCKLIVENGMRVLDAANEIRYCLRGLNISIKADAAEQPR